MKIVVLALALLLYVTPIVVLGDSNSLGKVTRDDVSNLRKLILHKSVDIYLVNVHRKGCAKVLPGPESIYEFVTKTGNSEFDFDGMKLYLLVHQTVEKELIPGYRHLLPTDQIELKFTRVARTAKKYPFLWETHTASRVCTEYGIYTNGRVECRSYMSSGQPMYMFAAGKATAEKIAGRECD